MNNKYLHVVKLFLLIFCIINLIEESQSKPYLFEFEKDGRKSMILGSNHYVPLSQLPRAIQGIILDHKILVGEVANTPTSMLTRDNLKKLLRTKKTKNYFKSLSKYQKKRIFAFANVINFRKNRIKIDQLTPLGLFTIYHSGCCARGIDCSMNDIFSAQGRLILGLEEMTFQSSNMSIQSLKDSIGTPSSSALIDRMYLQGSIEKISSPETLNEPMVRTRNENWFPKILTLHQECGSNVIFVVGASHLLGKYGILNLLYEQNFTIKRSSKNGTFYPYHVPSAQRKLFK